MIVNSDHQQRSSLPLLAGDPKISVVVTCYNYAHFLDACLESLFDQTRPPDEIIVVNDGSTDASSFILEKHKATLCIIEQENAGQASAFNRGFSASSGDIVLFLDADDLLDPIALETIAISWAPDLATLTFGLRVVNAVGVCTGVHPASTNANTGDNRPRLLATGTFRFPPTSGIAFARGFLSAVLPMPEARWRISADCYLVRAAALFGRAAHVSHVLGSYRIHGGNNYAISNATYVDGNRFRENLIDIADCLIALSETAITFSTDQQEETWLAEALKNRANAVRQQAEGGLENVRPPLPALDAVETAPSAHPDLQHLLIPRWPVHLCLNRPIGVAPHGVTATVADLVTPRPQDASDTLAGSFQAVFTIDPSPDVVELILRFAPIDDLLQSNFIRIRMNGERVYLGEIPEDLELVLPVRPFETNHERRIILEVYVDEPDLGVPELIGLEISNREVNPSVPFLDPGGWAPVGRVLGWSLNRAEWAPQADHSIVLTGGRGQLSFQAPGGAANELYLGFTDPPPRGSLVLTEGEQVLFTGHIGDSRSLLVRLPCGPVAITTYTLTILFESLSAEANTGKLGIKEIGLLARPDNALPPAAPLNLGETVHLGNGRSQTHHLRLGWEMSEDAVPSSASVDATISFRVATSAQDMVLGLDLEPMTPALPGFVQIVGVSIDGVLVAALEMAGAGTVEIALPSAHAVEARHVGLHSTFVAEASLATPEGTPGARSSEARSERDGNVEINGAAPSATWLGGRHAALLLNGFTLRGHERSDIDTRPLPRLPTPRAPTAQILLWEVDQSLSVFGSQATHEVAALRARLTRYLDGCGRKACALFVATSGAIDRLARVGARTRHIAPTTEEREILMARLGWSGQGRRFALPKSDAKGQDRLQAALLAILHVSAFELLDAPALMELPPPLLWARTEFADWLAAAPDIETGEDHAAYVRYLEQLLVSLDEIIACRPIGGALHALAAETVRRLRSTRMIFGVGNLRDVIRRRGRCIERLLYQEGAVLPALRAPGDHRRKLRIGVLVRDVTATPEGWALLGMYGGLDRQRFETVLIRLANGARSLPLDGLFDDERCLDGVDLTRAVETIRALDLDLFLTGAYAGEWEKAGLILAHRLAPLQIWPAAVCPTASGFRSFDLVLSCKASEPEDAEGQYTRPITWIEGPLQAAYAFAAPPRVPAGRLRRSLGLDAGRVLLVSGAMVHKIDDALLATWARILAGAPLADLVLYPYATNWAMEFGADRFQERLHAALAKVGVAVDRVKVLSTQTPEHVQAIVRACHLYLDSFPYTGATTVCEALANGTPVITRAGGSLRELTGASWVSAFGLERLITRSADEYVARAIELASSPKDLRALRRELASARRVGDAPHHDMRRFGPAFSDALWRAAQDSGLFPGMTAAPKQDMALIDKGHTYGSKRTSRILRMDPPARKMVILTAPRSGSSLLCQMINGTPGVCCHYELFHETMIEMRGTTVRDPQAVAQRDADRLGFLKTTMDQGLADGFQLVGFKHFPFFDQAVLETVIADPEYKIIVLWRNNLIAKFASLRIAESTSEWKVESNALATKTKISFDPKWFEKFEGWDNSMQIQINSCLLKHQREALFLEYTDILQEATGRRLSQFLGYDLNWRGNSPLQKINKGRVASRFHNPNEVWAYVKQRGFEGWMERG